MLDAPPASARGGSGSTLKPPSPHRSRTPTPPRNIPMSHSISRSLKSLTLAAGLCLAAAAATTTRADEGMWTLLSPPTRQLATHGFAPTADFLTAMQKAAIAFPGASGSFVSADGLIMTNHHVGSDVLAELSTAERDLLQTGFTALKRADELKCPTLTVSIVEQITDVTAQVKAAIISGMTSQEAERAIEAVISTIEQKATAGAQTAAKITGTGTKVRGEVITLFSGGRYHLHIVRSFSDVRLVFAPEAQAANFGGDGDNFEFPRHGLDACFFRAYVNDAPYKPESYLKVGTAPTAGATEGELALVFGHPGRTQRLLTLDDLSYQRDMAIPDRLRRVWRAEVKTQEFMNRGVDERRMGMDELFGYANSRKALTGQLAGLHDPQVMAARKASEQALIDAIKANAQWQAKFGGAFARISDAADQMSELSPELSLWTPRESDALTRALSILELAHQLGQSEANRSPRFKAGRLARTVEQMSRFAPAPAALQQYELECFLLRIAETVGGNDPRLAELLDGKAPGERASEVLAATALNDPAKVKALVEGGAAAIDRFKDPLLNMARVLDIELRPLNERVDREVNPALKAAYTTLAEARFAAFGDSVYPDANSSLRLSFGKIIGYEQRGTTIKPFTTFGSLFTTADARGKASTDYVPTASWQNARTKLNPATPFNFICTADIIGGNSGSPVVNTKGELIGLIFDGNIHSLPGAFVYDITRNRAIAVDIRAIKEALRIVYIAPEIADEIGR